MNEIRDIAEKQQLQASSAVISRPYPTISISTCYETTVSVSANEEPNEIYRVSPTISVCCHELDVGA